MLYNGDMETAAQLSLLSQDMDLEPDGGPGSEAGGGLECKPVIGGRSLGEIPITEAALPGGRRIKLLKTLLTSACERNCYYCPFRAGRDYRRATFKPDDMAKTFMALHEAKAAEGLFLSSGIAGGGIRTQDRLIDTAEILRKKYRYRGYLHLKIMPGAERDQVLRAMQLASRLSVNLEAPNTSRLEKLAPNKQFTEELLEPLQWIEQIRHEQSPHQTWNGRWPSTVTQFVVGAVGETDLELLSTSERLYRDSRLQRVYYSAFRPIADTPLENLPAENPIRQNRLYQSSFLLRDYGFDLEEMPFEPSGNLPLDVDPKLAWARTHLAGRPVEVNRAGKVELIRVPGIGVKGAERILQARRLNRILDAADLTKLGIQVKRAAPFVLLMGKQPAHQPALFEA